MNLSLMRAFVNVVSSDLLKMVDVRWRLMLLVTLLADRWSWQHISYYRWMKSPRPYTSLSRLSGGKGRDRTPIVLSCRVFRSLFSVTCNVECWRRCLMMVMGLYEWLVWEITENLNIDPLNYNQYSLKESRNSSVSIAMGYRLKYQGFDSR
jgi:hypothetical protein